MLLPLIFHGAGKFSLDALVAHWAGTGDGMRRGIQDVTAWGLSLLVVGVPLALLLPTLGLALAIVGLVLLAVDRLLLA
jgi:putative oxidoreductase